MPTRLLRCDREVGAHHAIEGYGAANLFGVVPPIRNCFQMERDTQGQIDRYAPLRLIF